MNPVSQTGRSAENDSRQRLVHAEIKAFRAGVTEMNPSPNPVICMFLGPSVETICMRNGRTRRGREVAGDLDIVPADTKSSWETKQAGSLLVMIVPRLLLQSVAAQLELDPSQVELADRFQLRDPQIEHIGWALKADIEAGGSGGRLFRESLGVALATRLLQRHNVRSLPMRDPRGGLSTTKLKHLVTHIEDNLESDLSLAEIAAVADMSVSHLKTLFRRSTGVPVHQYILRRRVERAKELLQEDALSITQIAFATGFAHQSHLARHMRKILGTTPAALRRESAAQ